MKTLITYFNTEKKDSEVEYYLAFQKMKLSTLYKGTQFATNLPKTCIRQQKAFRADIFFEFDLENDLFTMTLMCNQFENKCNQLRHLEPKSLKSDHGLPIYATFALRLAAILDLAEKEG